MNEMADVDETRGGEVGTRRRRKTNRGQSARMTKSSSGAERMALVQVQWCGWKCGSCACRTGESGGEALQVEGAGVPPKKTPAPSSNKLPPLVNACPSLEALPLFRPKLQEQPGACGVM